MERQRASPHLCFWGFHGKAQEALSSWKGNDDNLHMEDWERCREVRRQSILLTIREDSAEDGHPFFFRSLQILWFIWPRHIPHLCITSFPHWYGHLISFWRFSSLLAPGANFNEMQEVLKPPERFKQGVPGSDFTSRFTALAAAVWRMLGLGWGDKMVILLEKPDEFHMCPACSMRWTATVLLAVCRRPLLSSSLEMSKSDWVPENGIF